MILKESTTCISMMEEDSNLRFTKYSMSSSVVLRNEGLLMRYIYLTIIYMYIRICKYRYNGTTRSALTVHCHGNHFLNTEKWVQKVVTMVTYYYDTLEFHF